MASIKADSWTKRRASRPEIQSGYLVVEAHPIMLEDLSSVRFEFAPGNIIGRAGGPNPRALAWATYSERRKLRRSCFCCRVSWLLNRLMTAFASDPLPACC